VLRGPHRPLSLQRGGRGLIGFLTGYAVRLKSDLIDSIFNPNELGIPMRCVGFASVPA
jgi:hypothetical protein